MSNRLESIRAPLYATVALSIACATAVNAATVEWSNASGGNWNSAGNWDGVNIPDAAGESASINLDGTYSVVANQATNVDAISIGTTSTSGVQTVSLNTFSGFNFGNMTVGPRGIFRREHNGNVGGTGTITIQNGGLLTQSGTTKGLGNHHVVIDAGGEIQVAAGAILGMDANTNYTINGTITGPGGINGDSNGHSFGGTGTIAAGGDIGFGTRITNWSGNINVNRNVNAGGAFLIANNQSVTLNATFTNTNGTRSIGPQNNGETATVAGSGAINLSSNTGEMRFGGANSANNGGGTINFTGSGSLNLSASGAGFILITSSVMNLQRDTTISGSAGGFVRIAGDGNLVTASGAGNAVSIDSGGLLLIDSLGYEDRQFTVNGDAELIMNGGAIQGRTGDGGSIVDIGGTSAGTLSLAPGTSSSIAISSTGTGTAPLVVLHSNASLNAGAGSSLSLASALFQIDIDNPAQWGLDAAGTIVIANNATRFEALSDDLGDSVALSSIPLSLNALAFADSGVDPVFTLFDNADNDSVSGADVALYVQTLDLSGLGSGRTLTLDGFGGNERVYYQNIINPNGVTLGANYVQLVPEPASLSLLALAAGGMLRRRRD